ncbi:MAG TPA: cupin domain-containing protein [Thermomicrobiales bacterium]|nr:cupin domain-containing protein [Thermomicrobiales bacterium]
MDGTKETCKTILPTSAVTRRAALCGLGGMSLAALFAARWESATAQDATPPAPTGPELITFQLLGAGPTTAAPGLELTLRRTTLAPGAVLPDHTHPGALVIFVESGAFGYTPLDGIIQLTRAAVAGTPNPAETPQTGAEVILAPGDWLFVEDPGDAFRNAGEDDVVLLVAGLTRIGEPFTTLMPGMDMGATPTS